MNRTILTGDSFDTRGELFAALRPGLVGAEIGVNEGTLSHYILKHSKPRVLYMVDVWYPIETYGDKNEYTTVVGQLEFMRKALLSVRGFMRYGSPRPIVGMSARAATFVDNYSLDFVYIDANHSYEGCLTDLRIWSEKVRPGGMISGHDINCAKFGVTEAVEEYRKEIGLEKSDINVTREDYPSYWFFKP